MSTKQLLAAIENDDRSAVKKLLQADATLAIATIPNAKLYQDKIFHWIYVGDTPLHLAAAGYRVEIAQLLLAAGADANAAANHRESRPLHYAADACLDSPAWNPERQIRMIECLLEAGAEINAPDKNGATSLHRAVRTRAAAAVRCLLNAGADASLKNKPGSTAFHLAVQNTGRGGSGSEPAKAAQREIIEEFLKRGVSTQTKNGKGKTVLECATSDWVRQVLEN